MDQRQASRSCFCPSEAVAFWNQGVLSLASAHAPALPVDSCHPRGTVRSRDWLWLYLEGSWIPSALNMHLSLQAGKAPSGLHVFPEEEAALVATAHLEMRVGKPAILGHSLTNSGFGKVAWCSQFPVSLAEREKKKKRILRWSLWSLLLRCCEKIVSYAAHRQSC